MTKSEIEKALSSWLALCAVVSHLGEKDCDDLLKAELKGLRRPNYLLRIHGRKNKMRRAREHREMLGGAEK